LKATSTEHSKEKRDNDEVARSCSYPHSKLKENLLQCVVHNLQREPTTHGGVMGLYLVLVLFVISIVVVLLLLFISSVVVVVLVVLVVFVVVKIVGTRALFRLEEPSAPGRGSVTLVARAPSTPPPTSLAVIGLEACHQKDHFRVQANE